jgi:hypothetical protein
MAKSIAVSRRGLLLRVFLGGWILAMVASVIARAALAPPTEAHDRAVPAGLEQPASPQPTPNIRETGLATARPSPRHA